MVECSALLGPFRLYAKWMQLILAVAMFFGGLIHLNLKLDTDWCGTKSTDDYNCVGKSLVWSKDNKVGDSNALWRSVFTIAPDLFADAWTPFFFGIFAIIQHFPKLQFESLIGTWGKVLIFWLIGIFWAILGYAGNWGVFWGLFGCVGVCPVFLFLIVIETDEEPELETQLNLHHLLERCGAEPLENDFRDNLNAPFRYNRENIVDDHENLHKYSSNNPPMNTGAPAYPVINQNTGTTFGGNDIESNAHGDYNP